MTTDLVFNENGKALTNSLLVAKTFGKEHRRVTQDIRNLACSDNFRLHNFVQTTYTDSQNKTQPMFYLTRDGFTSVDFTELKDELSVTAENSAVLSDGRNLQRNLFQRL